MISNNFALICFLHFASHEKTYENVSQFKIQQYNGCRIHIKPKNYMHFKNHIQYWLCLPSLWYFLGKFFPCHAIYQIIKSSIRKKKNTKHISNATTNENVKYECRCRCRFIYLKICCCFSHSPHSTLRTSLHFSSLLFSRSFFLLQYFVLFSFFFCFCFYSVSFCYCFGVRKPFRLLSAFSYHIA